MINCCEPSTIFRDGLVRIFVSTVLFAFPLSANAQNPVLREIEVRSFLGEPLNLRVALAASTEVNSGAICQTVIDGDRRENALRSTDLILTMVELRDTRYLQIRSHAAYQDPVVRFSLRFGCPGEPAIDREFTALLDPPPFTSLPLASEMRSSGESNARPVTTTSPRQGKGLLPARAAPTARATGNWTVAEGDTLNRLAKGIYPKRRERQRQYIAAIRELNPELARFADDLPLAPGMRLAMPDLLALSHVAPRAGGDVPPEKSASTRHEPSAVKPAPVVRKSTLRERAQAARRAPVAAQITASESRGSLPAAGTAATASALSASPPKLPLNAKPIPRGESVYLRLSGSEMDLSRSRNVSDEQRRQLREKQLILDADDQVAALLSLKNTVTQLERRLNEIQLKQSSATLSMPSRPPAAPTAAPSAATVPPTGITTTAPISASPTPAPVAIAPPTATPPISASDTNADSPENLARLPAEEPVPQKLSFGEKVANALPDPAVSAGVGGVLIALLAAWVWSRRSNGDENHSPARSGTKGNKVAGRISRDEKSSKSARRASGEAPDRDSGFSDWAEQSPDDGPATEQPTEEAFFEPLREAPRNREAPVEELVVIDSTHDVLNLVDAPVVFEDTPASFVLDSDPATSVDFLVGMDEKLPEDRVRRLQYMHERYPELKSSTVSIDDPDSIINAARLYYEEGNAGNGRDKACELLTFAVEERPQEIRFWLAQFEIFRLENMAAEFNAMAGKFHVLFSHAPAWPKVRQIGHELDPGNPLFAASGSPLLAGESRFEPMTENWLNAPMDFTSDALMSDLRLALLDDHGVSRTDFESITVRLTASSAAA